MISSRPSEYSDARTPSKGAAAPILNGSITWGHPARIDRNGIRHFSSRELIFCEGDARTHVYQIEAGSVMIYRMLSDGRRQIIDFAHPGDFIGLGTSEEHFFSAEASTDTTVRSFSASALEEMAAQDPSLALQLYKAVSLELAAARALLVAIGQRSASERVASFLLMLFRRQDKERGDDSIIHLSMRRADIGDFLGLTIETVSRTITKLRAMRVIEVLHGTDIRILDAGRLEDLADGELAC
jgi:CRP/FNR family transcriptional regulator, anaerobic regulatory protein